MKNSPLSIYLEINDLNFIFFVTENNSEHDFKINHKLIAPLEGVENNRVTDLDKFSNKIKENIYSIEQKFDCTFTEIILILENFDPSFINLTGFKKLNGSQILRENITYILNTLKSHVDKTEANKKILHIFNTNFKLDNNKINNLPIGLFGDFYAHELSFNLIKKNDFKNLERAFTNCNLKIKKILLKSFVVGASINEDNKNIDSFFQIKINLNVSKIFYFENNSLKYEQEFKFGTNIIIQDISKITSLKKNTIEKILNEEDFGKEIREEELIDKKLFNGEIYRKIKKKLIYDIVIARISEILDLIVFKNNNINYYNEILNVIFFKIEDHLYLRSFKEIFDKVFKRNNSDVKYLNSFSDEKMLKTANRLVHFGWKREAIPITQSQKSLIARFFEAIFD